MPNVAALRFAWPAFACVAIERDVGRACGEPATWRAHPLASSPAWWTYCDRHRPAGAERIPAEASYHVTRATVTVAVASMLELRGEAVAEGMLRIRHVLEAAGAAIIAARPHGRIDGRAPAPACPFRLLLAGPPEPIARSFTMWPHGAANVSRRRPGPGSAAAGLPGWPRTHERRAGQGLARGKLRPSREAPGAPASSRRRKAG